MTVDIHSYDIERLGGVVLFANTPEYLLRRMRTDPVVQALSQAMRHEIETHGTIGNLPTDQLRLARHEDIIPVSFALIAAAAAIGPAAVEWVALHIARPEHPFFEFVVHVAKARRDDQVTLQIDSLSRKRLSREIPTTADTTSTSVTRRPSVLVEEVTDVRG